MISRGNAALPWHEWPKIIFITGTDTEVGKTITTAAVAGVLNKNGRTVAIYKPAQTGLTPDEPGDAETAAGLAGVTTWREGVRLLEPLAPTMAARRAGTTLPTLPEHRATITALGSEADHVIVEGAGGVLVGLGSHDETLYDLIALHPGSGVIVTIRAALGTLNHSLLTTRVIDTLNLDMRGLVIGSATPTGDEWPAIVAAENALEIQRLTAWPLLASIPAAQGHLNPLEFQTRAPNWFTQPVHTKANTC